MTADAGADAGLAEIDAHARQNAECLAEAEIAHVLLSSSVNPRLVAIISGTASVATANLSKS
jgi:hypothetical protein